MRPPTASARVLLAGSLLLPLLAALLLGLFAWPAVNTGPHGLPVGAVLQGPLRERFPNFLERVRPGGFRVTLYPSETEARQALLKRRVYGVFLLDPGQPEGYRLYLASAASPAAAQILTQVAEQLARLLAPAGLSRPEVVDLVPARREDPRQAGLAASGLPLVLTGALGGGLLGFGLRGRGPRLLGALLFPLGTGLAVAGVLQGYGTLGGGYLADALTAALAAGAMQAFAGGLAARLGVRGLALGVGTFVLSNPFSGLNGAPELLPSPWGAVGQAFPLGAFGTLARAVAFFQGAGAEAALWTLVLWWAAGLALLWGGGACARS